jgi:hypothetical protein
VRIVKIKKVFNNIFQTINILSLDVVAGSMMTGIFACKVLHVELHFWWIMILVLAVWVMYTTDHLLDAWRKKAHASIKRHLFHYKNIRTVLPVWIAIAIACIVLSLMMLEKDIIYLGILLGICILIYFGVIYFNKEKRSFFLQKELFIALIYVLGIWLAPIVWYGKNPDGTTLMIIANLVLLAWTEGILVSWFELHDDMTDKHMSFTVLFGKKTSKRFICFLLILVFVFSISGIFFMSNNPTIRMAFVIELMMGLVLALLISLPEVFSKNEEYRYVGEASFLLPGLIMII